MRKLYCILIVVTLAVMMTACGGTNASDKAVSVGKQAITVADDYLGGNIDYDTAEDKLDDLKSDMEYVDELSQDDENKTADFTVSSDLTLLSHAMLMDDIDNTSDTYDDVVEARNNLADDIGEKKR